MKTAYCQFSPCSKLFLRAKGINLEDFIFCSAECEKKFWLRNRDFLNSLPSEMEREQTKPAVLLHNNIAFPLWE